ncbi:glycine cleavage system H protein, mitochondrial [Monosporozyma unispora]|nr:glycine cleavage system H-protein subunit [Kazachstania unispora]
MSFTNVMKRSFTRLTAGQSTLLRNTNVTPRLVLSVRCQSTTAGFKNSLNKSELPFTYSSQGPQQVKYTKDHEWVAVHADGTGFLGITDYAAAALGDTTYVELPDTDLTVEAEESIGSVESVKSASEVYMPVDGTITEVNTTLEDSPQLINSDPLGKGWMIKFKLDDAKGQQQVDTLFNLEQYEEFLKTDEH